MVAARHEIAKCVISLLTHFPTVASLPFMTVELNRSKSVSKFSSETSKEITRAQSGLILKEVTSYCRRFWKRIKVSEQYENDHPLCIVVDHQQDQIRLEFSNPVLNIVIPVEGFCPSAILNRSVLCEAIWEGFECRFGVNVITENGIRYVVAAT